MSKDYYKILGIPKDATFEEIKKAYRKLAMQWHPDRHKGDKQAEEKFKDINEAYSVLSDPQKRKLYDQFGEVPSNNYSNFDMDFRGFGDVFSDIEDIFSTFFGSGFRSKKRNFDNKGEDLQINIKIDFLSSALGKEMELDIEHMVICENCKGKGSLKNDNKKNCIICGGTGYEYITHRSIFGSIQTQQVCSRCKGIGIIVEDPCNKCNGDGRVKKKEKIKFKIPAGIDDQQYIVLKNQGNAGILGGKSGDLYIVFSVEKSDKFSRNELNIISKIQIDVLIAILGGIIDIDTIHGKTQLTIPQGIQYGDKLIIKNAGIHADSGKKGDHIVIVEIVIPKKLNNQELELYKTLLNIKNKINN